MGPCPDAWGEGCEAAKVCPSPSKVPTSFSEWGCVDVWQGFSKWAATLRVMATTSIVAYEDLLGVVRRAGNKAPRVVSRPGQSSPAISGLLLGSPWLSPLDSSRSVASRPLNRKQLEIIPSCLLSRKRGGTVRRYLCPSLLSNAECCSTTSQSGRLAAAIDYSHPSHYLVHLHRCKPPQLRRQRRREREREGERERERGVSCACALLGSRRFVP
ncbi:hypothetical protein V8C34DRAFT_292845 [Trichoderma compactum]